MRNIVVVPWLCIVPLLQSCSTVPSDPLPWRVVPNAYVQHAAATPDAYYQLARYYQGENRHDQAIAALRKALALDESHAEAHNALGAIFANQGRFDLALPEFQRAIEIAPAAGHLRNNLGYALYLQQRYADAVILFEQAIALEPGNRNALNNLGLALAKLDLPEKSQAAFERAAAVPRGADTGENDSANQQPYDAAPPTRDAIRPIGAQAPDVPGPPKSDGIIALPTPASAISTAMAEPTMPAQPTPHSPLDLVEVHPKVYELRHREVAQTVATVPVASTEILATASPTRHFNLEVANGNGVPGMAKRVSRLLAASGLPVARLTNQKPFQQRETQIHYKDGYENEALRLSESLRTKPVVKKWTNGYGHTDVRVVLGKDVATRFASEEDDAELVRLAVAHVGLED